MDSRSLGCSQKNFFWNLERSPAALRNCCQSISDASRFWFKRGDGCFYAVVWSTTCFSFSTLKARQARETRTSCKTVYSCILYVVVRLFCWPRIFVSRHFSISIQDCILSTAACCSFHPPFVFGLNFATGFSASSWFRKGPSQHSMPTSTQLWVSFSYSVLLELDSEYLLVLSFSLYGDWCVGFYYASVH